MKQYLTRCRYRLPALNLNAVGTGLRSELHLPKPPPGRRGTWRTTHGVVVIARFPSFGKSTSPDSRLEGLHNNLNEEIRRSKYSSMELVDWEKHMKQLVVTIS